MVNSKCFAQKYELEFREQKSVHKVARIRAAGVNDTKCKHFMRFFGKETTTSSLTSEIFSHFWKS